jgi:hypothetical protein
MGSETRKIEEGVTNLPGVAIRFRDRKPNAYRNPALLSLVRKREQRTLFGVLVLRDLIQGRNMFGLELIPIGIAGAAGIFGHVKSRKFVRRRLRYTSWVEKPYLGLVAGVTAAILAAPLSVLPLLGTSTALIFGAGVGTGVSMGAREAREGSSFDDD